VKRKSKNLQELGEVFFNLKTEESFTEVYHILSPRLKRFISGYLKAPNFSQDDIDDCVSNSMIKIYMNIHQYNSYWNFSTWSYTIAKNEALKKIAKSKKLKETSMVTMNGWKNSQSDSDYVGDLHLSKILKECIDDYVHNPNYDNIDFDHSENLTKVILEEIKNLNPKYKEILWDREVNEMSYIDLANKYDLNLNTLKVYIHKGRKILQKRLKKVYEEWKNS
jgi:RNA polymerase sigma-70 factor (ECF subfamily)